MGMENRVVVITGATGGLGSVTSAAFAAQGAHLALVSTNQQKLDHLIRKLNLSEDRYVTITADLGVKDETDFAAARILAKFGHVDILLHLVGGWSGGKPILEVESAQVEEMLRQHLWTTYNLVQAFLPGMLAQHWGRIIAVSSPFASHPSSNLAPYVIGKAAQEALLLSVAREAKDTGVTANMLLVKNIDTRHERQTNPSPKNVSWTTPEEIFTSLMYLCSEEAGMINGARLPLYGEM